MMQIQKQAALDSRAEAVQRIRAAQRQVKQNRASGFAALNEIFRAGTVPHPPLDGRYAGELVALDIAPGLTKLGEMVAAIWMPWQGKTFDAARSRGDNIFQRNSLPLARVMAPFYRGFIDDGSTTYRAFTFRTYIAPGKTDPDQQVLKIDYDLAGNPRLTIRRVLDELVQLADVLYLGKAHFKWWWGNWQLVGYFTLSGQHKR
jgi:hypothetical protein